VKIQFHVLGLRDGPGLRHWCQRSLSPLARRLRVHATAVVLERGCEATPGYRVHVLLAVPGPDLEAEARDYTLEAAWRKVTAALRREIERRDTRQQARARTNGHLRVPLLRRSRRAAPARV
jgi:ribosome-associated translation inhibitor RaiA